MRQCWQLFEDAFTPQLCDSIVDVFSKLPEQEATTFNGNSDHRKSKVRWVDGENDLRKMLMHFVDLANANAFGVDLFNVVSEMQFTEYSEEDQSFYKWHHDVDWTADNVYDRKLSVVVQLSDPETYVGGEFMFNEVENPSTEQLKRKGALIVFPSYLSHQVTPVTEGTRYSLVSWVRGPRWR